MASVFETWIAALAETAQDIARQFRPPVAVEAFEQADGFHLRWTGGKEIGVVGPDGAIVGRRAQRIGQLPINVRLGDRHRIVDRIVFPAATKAYLSAVIGNQIDRLAPFDESDAVYSWRVEGDAPPAEGGVEQIGVMVAVASRRRLLETVRPLVVAGLVPKRIAVGNDAAAPPVIVSLETGNGEREQWRWRANAAVVALVILGVVGYAGSWWLQRSLAGDLAAVQATLAARRDAIQQASLTRTDAAANQARIVEIAADKARRNALPVLDRLSIVLPDSVYLTKFEVAGAVVRISGFAADAASLVPLLESDDQIGDVRFVAPIARPADATRDGFDMALSWQPAAPPGGAP